METETTIEVLVDAGVLECVPTGAGYEVAASFVEAVDDRHEEEVADLGPSALREHVRAVFDDEEVVAIVGDVGEDDREFATICLVLGERLGTTDDVARIASVVQQYRRGVPRDEGAPETFLAVHGDRLETLTRLYERSVVYIWREDCEPCDAMRETLEGQFETDPDDVALFAVYGPDYARTLADAFGVVGGPTTLFVREGRVESRLQGAHHPESVGSEVQVLREE
ncbi:thioredoxin family protein [Halomarina halobia]|uniref:Thioredoxin family protein n=1 Tax=Halomarina halobia TaxID=3033386 RepID=A0ABD6AE64_9EURY|nr:thioredoxin family protein [Halomarina sp. PSR21]